MNVYLIGFMGVGKTSAAKRFLHSVDTDERIKEIFHETPKEIIVEHGEYIFRNCESYALRNIRRDDIVVSCGGGIVLRKENIEWMHSHGIIIWLDCSDREILRRIGRNQDRPLFDLRIKNKRDKIYRDACDFKIDTTGKSVREVVVEIEKIIVIENGKRI